MLTIGCHLSISKGYLHMGKEALSLGANTFQYFTRNPRGGKARTFDEADMKALEAFMAEHNFGQNFRSCTVYVKCLCCGSVPASVCLKT